MQRPARRITPADWSALCEQLERAARSGDLEALRLRALILTAHSGAIDLRELLALDLTSVLDPKAPHRRRFWTESPRYMRLLRDPSDARQRRTRPKRRTPPVLYRGAAGPVLEYLRASLRAHRVKWSLPRAPLFHGPALEPVPARTVQHQFSELQRAAGFPARYRFADLRHTAICNRAPTCSVGTLAVFARVSPRQALAYVSGRGAVSLAELDPVA